MKIITSWTEKKIGTLPYLAWLLIFIFTLVYIDISFVNHYLFRTYALDLGIYTKALWDYAHFQFNDSLLFRYEASNLLSAHFDLYLMIFSPLVHIFGSYTLLIIQILAVIFGGIGVFKLTELYTNNKALPLLSMLFFFSFFGVIHTISYDYHSNVVASMIIPWFFYFFKKEKYVIASLLILAILIGKENMALLVFFICIGLMWDYRKHKKSLYMLASYAVFSLIYFAIVIEVIMPSFSAGNHYEGFKRYEELGSSFKEVVINLAIHPIETIKLLFVNQLDVPNYDFIKTELHISILLSGLLFLFFKPNYIFMLIPIYCQKMFSNDPVLWGISLQYNIEFVPIIASGIFIWFSSIHKLKKQYILSISAVVLCIGVSIYTIINPITYLPINKVNIFKKSHYVENNFSVKEVYKMMKLIPKDAPVCACTLFVPHLATRDKIYTYPLVFDSEYLLLNYTSWTYSEDDYKLLDIIIHEETDKWTVVKEDYNLVLLKRK